jgi:hypothetical protein
MATVIANEGMTDDVGLLDRRECRLMALPGRTLSVGANSGHGGTADCTPELCAALRRPANLRNGRAPAMSHAQ